MCPFFCVSPSAPAPAAPCKLDVTRNAFNVIEDTLWSTDWRLGQLSIVKVKVDKHYGSRKAFTKSTQEKYSHWKTKSPVTGLSPILVDLYDGIM